MPPKAGTGQGALRWAQGRGEWRQVLPWLGLGVGGALAPPLHPPQLGSAFLGSGLPEQAANCGLWVRFCQAGREGPGGDERAFVSLFVSRWESTSSHQAARGIKERAVPGGRVFSLPSFLSGVSLGPPFSHLPPSSGPPARSPPADLGPRTLVKYLPTEKSFKGSFVRNPTTLSQSCLCNGEPQAACALRSLLFGPTTAIWAPETRWPSLRGWPSPLSTCLSGTYGQNKGSVWGVGSKGPFMVRQQL